MTLDLIKAWHAEQLRRPFEEMPVRIVMGLPVFGEPYTEYFTRFGLPSILAWPNVQAFRQHGGCLLHVWGTKPLDIDPDSLPIQYRWEQIPPEIMAGFAENPLLKYPLLAAIHNLLIHRAGQWNAGFHMTVADAVYDRSYFANLLRLAETHEGIAHSGFNVDAHFVKWQLEDYRCVNGSLSIPARALGQAGCDHPSPQWKYWSMDDVDEDFSAMPHGHLIHWRAQDHVRFYSPHLNAAWISPARCRKVTQPLGGTIDSELPRYMGEPFYVPQLTDDMAYICLAGGDITPPPHAYIPWDEWKQFFWDMTNEKFVPYFKAPVAVPLTRYDPTRPTDAELDRRAAKLFERMMP